MTNILPPLEDRLRQAVRHFWLARQRQGQRQGEQDESARDRGGRRSVTSGKHMDGFIRVVKAIVVEAGLTNAQVFCKPREDESAPRPRRQRKKKRKGEAPEPEELCEPMATDTILPGWFRAEKDWDLIVICNRLLVAVVEFKSHVGSFGNNCNNRIEEALGNSTDLLAAYREGAFKPSLRPWLGYLMLLEEAAGSTRPVRVREPHFRVFPEFRSASYAERYNQLLLRLVRERLYDSACFLMSPAAEGLASGLYREPNAELSFANFVASLLGHASAVARTQPPSAESATGGRAESTPPTT
ncbi:MAG: PaeR7I family type II restriction endonuclease [Gemmataceae bacterium]|nr:PaeR7I family type II restriction endonuclease [Gemmataceae bacterium]